MRIWSLDATVLFPIPELFFVLQDCARQISEAELTPRPHEIVISLGFQSPLSMFLWTMQKHVKLPNIIRFRGGWMAQ